MIEYVNATWNPLTGCQHGQAECPVYAECWARSLSKRFKQICGGDFKPRFHLDRLDAPLYWRKPRRVAVSFMGDLWGDWEAEDSKRPGYIWSLENRVALILSQIAQCPQHRFLFLTKQPRNLPQFNPWPSNAWVGMTLTGAEPPDRQAAMLEALGRVQGPRVRWLSYEPVIKSLAIVLPSWLDWIVIGGWSGKRQLSADGHIGMESAIHMCEIQHISRWEKSNLTQVLEAPLHQELP